VRNRLLVAAFLAGTACLAGIAATAADVASIAGTYAGQYECDQQWFTFTATLAEPVNGASSGEATFPLQRFPLSKLRGSMPNVNKPFKLRGSFDAGRGALTLRTSDGLVLSSNGKDRKVTFEATVDAKGYLVGTLDYPGCHRFVLVPTTAPGNPTNGAQRYVQNLQGEERMRQRDAQAAAAHEARVRSGWVSPELRPNGGAIEYPTEMMAYSDLKSGRAVDPFEAVRPIDVLNQFIVDHSYKCIGTKSVAWNGAEGLVSTALFSTKRYVVECNGRCEGLTYRLGHGGANHFGQSMPYPTVEIRTMELTDTPFNWQFIRRDASGEPPQVRIHIWTNGFDYGPRCQID